MPRSDAGSYVGHYSVYMYTARVSTEVDVLTQFCVTGVNVAVATMHGCGH